MRHGGNLSQFLQKNVLEEEEHLQQEQDKPIMYALYLVGDGTQVEESGGDKVEEHGTEGMDHRRTSQWRNWIGYHKRGNGSGSEVWQRIKSDQRKS